MSQNVGLSEVLTCLQSSNPGSETGRCRELQICADADSVDDDTVRLLQSSSTLQRFTAKGECWAIHFLIKLSSHSAIRIVGVDTMSGSLSKFSQIPGVSFFQTITGTDPPKPRFIAHLGIGEKHQSYSLGFISFIFSNLARNTVDIS